MNSHIEDITKYEFDVVITELFEDILSLGSYQKRNFNSYIENGENIFQFQQKWIKQIPQILNQIDNTHQQKELNIQLEICCLCLEEEPATLFEPCGHIVSCEKCVCKLIETNNRHTTRCPVCRADLDLVYCLKTNQIMDPRKYYQNPMGYRAPTRDEYIDQVDGSELDAEDDNISEEEDFSGIDDE